MQATTRYTTRASSSLDSDSFLACTHILAMHRCGTRVIGDRVTPDASARLSHSLFFPLSSCSMTLRALNFERCLASPLSPANSLCAGVRYFFVSPVLAVAKLNFIPFRNTSVNVTLCQLLQPIRSMIEC